MFLWHGAQVDLARQKGSLCILKSFYQVHLSDTLASLQPSYLLIDDNQIIPSPKFTVEYQSSESRRFRALFSPHLAGGSGSSSKHHCVV